MARRTGKVPDPRLVDARHRVSVPRAVLRALEVQAGDYVAFEVEMDGQVRLRKLSLTFASAPPP